MNDRTYEDQLVDSIHGHLHNLTDYMTHTAHLQRNAHQEDIVIRAALDLLNTAKDKIEADLLTIGEHIDIRLHRRCYDQDCPERCGELVSVDIKPVPQPAAKPRALKVV